LHNEDEMLRKDETITGPSSKHDNHNSGVTAKKRQQELYAEIGSFTMTKGLQ